MKTAQAKADAAGVSADKAQASETAAAKSAESAGQSKSAASASENAAARSATAASDSAAKAKSSETAASASAASAKTDAQAASGSAREASGKAAEAAASAANAKASETAAKTSQTAAAKSAGDAAGKMLQRCTFIKDNITALKSLTVPAGAMTYDTCVFTYGTLSEPTTSILRPQLELGDKRTCWEPPENLRGGAWRPASTCAAHGTTGARNSRHGKCPAIRRMSHGRTRRPDGKHER